MEVYPVIHINKPAIAAEQANIAFAMGADGVYLIDHVTLNVEPTLDTFTMIDKEHSDAYIGVNFLGMYPMDALRILKTAKDIGHIARIPDGLWFDNVRREYIAGETRHYKHETPGLQNSRLLGGIAFKYTETFTEDPRRAAHEVHEHAHKVDVITTSGAETGQAPTPAKIAAMKKAAGIKTLAVASGISIENISEYRGMVDEILVASSVETTPYSGIFDHSKLRAFFETALQE